MTTAADASASGRDKRYWERHAQKYDLSMRLIGKPMPRMAELAAEAVRGAGRVLEVAAGTGLVTAAIARSAEQVVATDYASAMVEMLRGRVQSAGLVNVTCQQADLYALPFESASFDAVVAANVLHLVPDLDGAIASLRRVVRPGGKLVVPTFCHDETILSALVSRVLGLTGFPGHRRFTSASLQRALADSGLRIAKCEVIAGLHPIAHLEGTTEPR